jgi:hypothetical protein
MASPELDRPHDRFPINDRLFSLPFVARRVNVAGTERSEAKERAPCSVQAVSLP